MVTVKINGKEITVEDNTLILDAARSAGYEIPTFCYQADLMGVGSCRMCLVEIEGQRKLQPSCVTPVLHGMSINTDSNTVQSARAGVLEFLLANHALDCPVCDKAGECELQDMVHKHGPHKGRHAEPKFKFHEKDYVLSPVIVKNSNRCVQCMKCVRVCREVVGQNVLGALGRGDHQEPTSFFRHFLNCEMDGNCIEVCPVGCFMRLPYRYKARPWDLKSTDSICPYCATGCRTVIEERDGVLLRARAQLGVGLNSETLCVRGRFGQDFVSNPERITQPLIKRYGKLEPVTWEEAVAHINESLSAIQGDRIGGIASARLTNEELYLFQKLMRGPLGSPNIDSSARFAPEAVESFISATGMAEGGVSVYDVMDSDTVLVIGTHLSDENPVIDYIARRISGTRRMNLVIASTRAMKLDSSANAVLRHSLAAENAALTSIIISLNEGKLGDALKGMHDTELAANLKASGLEAGAVKDVARRLAASESVGIIAGTDFLRFPEGTAGLGILKDLLRSRGKKVRVMPVLDRANQRGAWEMGVHPHFGPGYSPVKKGLGTDGMLEAAMKGELDALWVIGADVAAMYPDEDFARSALSKVGFLVVQDLFMSDTARQANVVLPGAAHAEKDGTFTNQEGRVQLIKKLMRAPGKAKQDVNIIRAVGESFDRSFGPKHFALVLDEIRKEVPSYSEASLKFNNKRNSDNRLDNREALVKASAAPAPPQAKFTGSNAEFGAGRFLLSTGNHLYHSGRCSTKSETLLGLLKGAVVEISEEDAAELDIRSGEKVRVRGGGFEAQMTLIVRKGTRKGVAFIGENFVDAPVSKYFKRGAGIPRVDIIKTI